MQALTAAVTVVSRKTYSNSTNWHIPGDPSQTVEKSQDPPGNCSQAHKGQ